jgi:hypothetical protein
MSMMSFGMLLTLLGLVFFCDGLEPHAWLMFRVCAWQQHSPRGRVWHTQGGESVLETCECRLVTCSLSPSARSSCRHVVPPLRLTSVPLPATGLQRARIRLDGHHASVRSLFHAGSLRLRGGQETEEQQAAARAIAARDRAIERARHKFCKVPFIVTSYSKYTRTLNFENFYPG